MKKQHLNLFGLCTLAALCSISCDDEGNGKYTCDRAAECAQNLGGDVSYWKCNIEYRKCEAQVPEHCFNGVIDSGKETGKDCGGVCVSESKLKDSSAFKCDNKVTCTADADCKSNACVNKVCSEKTCSTPNDCPNNGDCVPVEGSDTRVCVSCFDGARNQDESDVDCGGSCSAKCEAGKACNTGSDCVKGVCEGGKCSDVELKAADPASLIINEVFDSAKGSPAFSLNGDATACEFIEIANPSDEVVNLAGLSLVLDRTDDDKGTSIVIPLDASDVVLPAKNLLVVHSCDSDFSVPASVKMLKTEIDMKSTGTYNIYIKSKDAKGPEYSLELGGSSKAPKSSYVRDPEFKNDSIMKQTIEVDGYAAPVTPGYCTNGGIYSEGCISTCNNNKLDGSETDVDCGGSCSAKCAEGKNCALNEDCSTNKCEDNLCVKNTCSSPDDCGEGFVCDTEEGTCKIKETCSDGVKNQDETDVDCGGTCSPCAVGKNCSVAKDCVSNECTDNVCTGDAPKEAAPDDLFINEIMVAEDTTSGSVSFFTYNGNGPECKFVEIINISDAAVSVDNCELILDRTDESGLGKSSKTSLNGSLVSKGMLVASYCDKSKAPDGIALPSGTLEAALGNTSNITQGGTYDAYVKCGEVEGTHIAVEKATKGTSMNRPEDGKTSNNLILHSAVASNTAKVVASPGYCANGGLFSEGCKADCGNGTETCGRNCAKCENGVACKGNEDCASGECTGNVCTGVVPEVADPASLVINEILDSGARSPAFSLNGDAVACEFIEIANPSDQPVSLAGLTLVLERTDDGKGTSIKIPLDDAGTLAGKNLLVVHGCESNFSLPDDAKALMHKIDMKGTGTYNTYLSAGDVKGPEYSLVIGSVVNSSYVRDPEFKNDSEMKKTVDVDGYAAFATPGYCTNGGKYSENCAVSTTPVTPATPSIESLDDAAKAYYDFQMKCWGESEGSEDELKQEFNSKTLCEKEIKDYVISIVSKTCADIENIKAKEDACQSEDCINELYASWEPAQTEEVLKTCYREKYPE